MNTPGTPLRWHESEGLLRNLELEVEHLRYSTRCTAVEGVAPRELMIPLGWELAERIGLAFEDVTTEQVDDWLKAQNVRISWVDSGVTALQPQMGLSAAGKPLGVRIIQAQPLSSFMLWPATTEGAM
ncbi:hypothetical protein AB0A05_27095 [Streptomyces sp. NPDC046374]|uniref:hypothetical protein n=1 Tax=Streptomyces sp. NPDC046374 TaxID=3154917 RepID=UPI0033E8FCDC